MHGVVKRETNGDRVLIIRESSRRSERGILLYTRAPSVQ